MFAMTTSKSTGALTQKHVDTVLTRTLSLDTRVTTAFVYICDKKKQDVYLVEQKIQ